jgi:hypothetical protein
MCTGVYSGKVATQEIHIRLVMSSGKEYEVRHPEMAWVLRNDVLVGVDITDNGMPAEFDICPLLHVASIEPFNLQDSNPTP